MDEFIKNRNELLAQKVVKALQKRNFEAYYAENKEQAKDFILKSISKDEVISWGGSVTVDELNLKENFKKFGYKTLDRDSAKTPQEKEEIILKSLTSDVFLMSANALSEDGEIVNIDKKGNRIAALCFGAKKVFVIVGMNKIVKSLDDAISRARNFAAPINAQRVSKVYEMNTPCLNTGSCADCKMQDSICSHILITRLSSPKGRINVVIVNENLGF